MHEVPEHLIAWNKAGLAAAVRFTSIALQGTERILELQLSTAKNALAESVERAKGLADLKDAKDYATLKNTYAPPSLEQATAYAKKLYDVATTTQSEINLLVHEQISEYNKSVATTLDKYAESAPAGSELAVAAIKSAVSAVNSAYGNLSKSAQQFSDMAKANIDAAAAEPTQACRKKAA